MDYDLRVFLEKGLKVVVLQRKIPILAAHNPEVVGSSPASATISSVHNGFQLWTLDFYALMYEQAVCLLNFYALLVTYSTATPLRVSAV